MIEYKKIDDDEDEEDIEEDDKDDEDEDDEEQEGEVEVLEFSLTKDDINELIEELVELKETKSSFGFSIDDENEIIIHYDNEEEESD